jgi:exonuclease SbcC
VETTQDLFKQLEEAEKLFSDGSIKNGQKKVRDVMSQTKNMARIPNNLKHKLNFAIGQSRYFDEISSFAANPKREELITEIKKIIDIPLAEPKKQAHLIHDLQAKWQLLDVSSRPASREQWNKFNELTNTAWEPCREYFDELKEIKINNAKERELIIQEISSFVEKNLNKWSDARTLIQFLRGMFDKWQRFAPVLDKDLNKLKSAYFEARKPINDQIKKQEQVVIKAKEALIAKVDAISSEDSDVCIKQFNDLKNDWKVAGSAGRKADNKLWDKFNKSADRFFNAKKEVIDAELLSAKNLLNELKDGSKSINDIDSELRELKNIFKTKEYITVKESIRKFKDQESVKLKESKIKAYLDIFKMLNDDKEEISNLPKSIESALTNSRENKKTDKEALLFACIKLEILSGLESLKKDAAKRQAIQLQMLTNKFNKSSDGLDNLDGLLVSFISNFSTKDSGAPEKALWVRVAKTVEVLVNK